jgi:hypothetical protein
MNMMRAIGRRTRVMVLGLVIAVTVLTTLPVPARAQFGGVVFDPKNYALQLEKKI